MAQRSILSMFKKSNDRVGNPVQDKIQLGKPDNGMQCGPGKLTETLSVLEREYLANCSTTHNKSIYPVQVVEAGYQRLTALQWF